MVNLPKFRKIKFILNCQRVVILQWLFLVVFFLVLGLLIDYRLRQIEKIRCELWEWDVCVKINPDLGPDEYYFDEEIKMLQKRE